MSRQPKDAFGRDLPSSSLSLDGRRPRSRSNERSDSRARRMRSPPRRSRRDRSRSSRRRASHDMRGRDQRSDLRSSIHTDDYRRSSSAKAIDRGVGSEKDARVSDGDRGNSEQERAKFTGSERSLGAHDSSAHAQGKTETDRSEREWVHASVNQLSPVTVQQSVERTPTSEHDRSDRRSKRSHRSDDSDSKSDANSQRRKKSKKHRKHGKKAKKSGKEKKKKTKKSKKHRKHGRRRSSSSSSSSSGSQASDIEEKRKPEEEEKQALEVSAVAKVTPGGRPSDSSGPLMDQVPTDLPPSHQGTGTLTSARDVVKGLATRFKSELEAKDGILIRKGKPDEEFRMIRFVLSDSSLSLSKPFAKDVEAPIVFHIVPNPHRQQLSRATFASSSAPTSREGGSEAERAGISREELLDTRMKSKTDRMC